MSGAIKAITTRLKELHIEQTNLLNELERLVDIQKSETNAEPEPKANTRQVERKDYTKQTKREGFSIGDRVRVKNPRAKSALRSLSSLDQYGKVVNVTAKRVHVTTDNKVTIQRAPKNIEHIDQQETR
jgi:hypothetical protein